MSDLSQNEARFGNKCENLGLFKIRFQNQNVLKTVCKTKLVKDLSYLVPIWPKLGPNLTLRKIAIWLSKNCQKLDIFFNRTAIGHDKKKRVLESPVNIHPQFSLLSLSLRTINVYKLYIYLSLKKIFKPGSNPRPKAPSAYIIHGYEIWPQSGSDWPQMGQIREIFRSDSVHFGAPLA